MSEASVPSYFRYWGKARPDCLDGPRYHQLAFHSLDVAACGQLLLQLPQFSLHRLAEDLGWPLAVIEALATYFLGQHDLGKFASSFQGLAPGLSPELVQNHKGKVYKYRHDTLGRTLWVDRLAERLENHLPASTSSFWQIWIGSAVGHHGKPPMEAGNGGLTILEAHQDFTTDDVDAACAFTSEAARLWLPDELPVPTRKQAPALKAHTWRLAGLAVLADWLGSNQALFPYRSEPMPLSTYWEQIALPQARRALRMAGLSPQPVQPMPSPLKLFDHLEHPTPLQAHAATCKLDAGPQLFLLEDVTGAGKTEAALILAQRLLQSRQAHGLYFALPSMATANQMYERVGRVYRRFYMPSANPSLVLAHGARELVDGFTDSVLQYNAQPSDPRYTDGEDTASVQCNAWLADSRKKSLLADVGVGTLDQALLSVLPVRHQSLRLLGLSSKVLIVDEVHAYDTYMRALLKHLLEAHARQNGSAILLSATLPASFRQELAQVYRTGLNIQDSELAADLRYPLATRIGQTVSVDTCDTRASLVRRVRIAPLHDETTVIDLLAEQAEQGRCVCWIRNTVDDARRAHAMLEARLGQGRADLFHSRYAMGDRLDIEARVLRDYGKKSDGAVRRGRILVGTQVLEQSLDFDVDIMVTDLAPIDLIIQRAGRLQRHARLADGTPSPDGREHRPEPILYVLMPEPSEEPDSHWYARLFPKAVHVYPNVGNLWRSARALLRAGYIVSPGTPDEPGAVRNLVESVYGEHTEDIPDALLRATHEQLGKDLAMNSQGEFNTLAMAQGYCWDSNSMLWDGNGVVPTRLGDETRTVFLAVECNGTLQSWRQDGTHAWDQSAVRVDARQIADLGPALKVRYETQIQALRDRYRVLEEPALVMPVLPRGNGAWESIAARTDGDEVRLTYDNVYGLMW
ncbi:CRISPR-associated helicase Cas3' [Verticiella sediminum]|nr:CRISPR-associated helicase Cas3' [Verticiella sediminum]